MDTTLSYNALMAEQDKRIAETVLRERGRLGNFIRRRVPDASEAEGILQDVFYEFVAAYRLPEPIEQVGAVCGDKSCINSNSILGSSDNCVGKR